MGIEFAKICRENLLAIASTYGRATGASLEQISKTFYGKSSFLRELCIKRSRSVSIDIFDGLINSIQAALPKGTEWPPTEVINFKRPKKIRTTVPRNGKVRA